MIEIITEADYKDRLAATQNGVLLFFKKLCPHCKNMEKVLEVRSRQTRHRAVRHRY
ncbi:MAG: hypothetical protein ACLSHC_04495 [Bilophila wadsworthia]